MAQKTGNKIFINDRKRTFFFAIKMVCAALMLLLLGGAFLFVVYARDLPRPEKFTESEVFESTKIYDRTGQVLLYEVFGEEKRTAVPITSISDYLKNGVIATEDADFYNHFGVSIPGTLRSVLADLKLGSPAYGGSTITQQLIRSTFLTPTKTISRKIKEIVLSIELDRRYPKEQILEWYLNQIPFGRNTYGAEAASQAYFKKSASEISLAQAAVLAAVIQAPSYLSPDGSHKDELLARKDYVLDRMAITGYITKEQAEEAKKEEIKFEKPIYTLKAPHFTLWVLSSLEEKYGESLREKGLKVYTTLDWDLQQKAEASVEAGAKNNRALKAYNAALVASDPKTGEILSMVGSADFWGDPYPEGCVSGYDCLFDPWFNAAVGTRTNPGRQPGSSFKPFVYAAAFEKGYNSLTTVVDELTDFGVYGGTHYIPQNYDGLFRGEVTLRSSLAQSLNIPAVKTLLNLAGLDDSIKTAQNMGITTLTPPYYPSIVLGGWEVKLVDMVAAYGVFANEGLQVPPVSILKIEDRNGNIIEENKKTPKRVLSVNSARLISDILSDNEARAPIFGYNSNLYYPGYDVAVKTGTTQDYKDGWMMGYTPFISLGVWVGNNNAIPMAQEPGTVMAGPIFHSFMAKVLASHAKENFIYPELPVQPPNESGTSIFFDKTGDGNEEENGSSSEIGTQINQENSTIQEPQQNPIKETEETTTSSNSF